MESTIQRGIGNIVSQLSDIAKDISVYNANSLYHWRLLRAKQRAGVATKGHVALFGDSVGAGYYVNASMTDALMNTNSFFGLLSEYYRVNVGDVGVGWKSCLAATASGYWTFSGTWADRSTNVIGGRQTTVNGAYGTCPFTCTDADLWVCKDPYGAASVDILVDDVLNQNVNLDLVNTAKPQAFKIALSGYSDAAHTIKIVNNTVNYLVGLGVHEVKGTNGISFLNFSRPGKTTAYLADNTGVPDQTKQALEMYAYDLVIIGYMINDAASYAVDLATFKARYEAFVDEAKGNNSDVIILVERGKVATYSGNEDEYIAVMKDVALAKNVCFIDIANRWKPAIDSGAVTQYLYDTDHPNQYGHYDIYKALLDVLES